jgi:hypothetical protein
MSENNEKKSWKDSAVGKFFINTSSGFIANLLLALIIYLISVYNVIPVIKDTKRTLDSVKVDLCKIKNFYVTKDKEGVDIKVGINSELEGNNVTVFKNNSLGLNYTQAIYLTNPIDFNNFCPTVQLIVTCEVEKGDDKTGADIFISKDAASRLGLTRNISKGVFTIKMRIKEKE